MTLTQIGGNARHHRIIEFADADRQRQQQVEQCGKQRLHRGNSLQRTGGLVTNAWLIGDKNKQQADDPRTLGPGQLDEKQIEGEIHAGGTYAGFPLAVIVGEGHQREVQRQREA